MAYGNKAKSYYKIVTVPNGGGSLKVTKFTPDLEVESSYYMNWIESANGGYFDCQCPASRFDCRHKTIHTLIKSQNEIDGDRFFCFETKTFHDMKDVH